MKRCKLNCTLYLMLVCLVPVVWYPKYHPVIINLYMIDARVCCQTKRESTISEGMPITTFIVSYPFGGKRALNEFGAIWPKIESGIYGNGVKWRKLFVNFENLLKFCRKLRKIVDFVGA